MILRLLVIWFKRLGKKQAAAPSAKVLLAVAAIVWYSSSGYLYFELRENPDLGWADAIWWSLVTMTTVGYGDFFPSSNWGRFLVGLPTMLFGISILGYLLANVASVVLEGRSMELKGMKRITAEDHILIVHFSDANRIQQVVDELQADSATRGKPIVLIDNELEELPPELAELGVKFVRGNPARQATLEQANYAAATHALVLSKDPKDVRSDDLNLAVTMTIEGLRSDIRTVTECVDDGSLEILRRTGSDSIVCASGFSSSLLVQELLDPGVQAVFAELTTTTEGQQFYVSPIDDMSSWTFEALSAWAAKDGLMAVGVKRGGSVHLNPDKGFALEHGDEAVLIGAKRPESIRA